MPTATAPVPPPDLLQARAFLGALGGGPTAYHAIRTSDDRKPADRNLERQLPREQAEAVLPALADLNAAGAGVHVHLAAMDGKGCAPHNAMTMRAVLVRWDGKIDLELVDREVSKAPPSILLRGPRGPIALWLLEEAADLWRAICFQRQLVSILDGSYSNLLPAQTVRLPGFWFCETVEPYLVSTQSPIENPSRYNLEDLIDRWDLTPAVFTEADRHRKFHNEASARSARLAAGLMSAEEVFAEQLKAAEFGALPPAATPGGGARFPQKGAEGVSFIDLSEMPYKATPTIPDGHPLSVRGNAGRFAETYKATVRLCPPLGKKGKWFIWDGKVWEPDERQGVHALGAQRVAAMHELWDHDDFKLGPDLLKAKKLGNLSDEQKATLAHKNKMKSMLASHLMKSEKPNAVREMVEYAGWQRDLQVMPGELDTDDFLINTPTGVVDITDNLKVLPHDPDRYQTRITSVGFNPKAECPIWLDFLKWAMCGDQALVDFLQRAAGYSFTGTAREHKLLLCWGSGGNGKGTFFTALMEILDSYAKDVPFELFTAHKPQDAASPNPLLMSLKDARMVSASEPEQGARLSEALVKRVTAADPITTRAMFSNTMVTFKPKLTLWLATNHKPVIRGTDDGIWRRVCLIPWEASIEKTPAKKDLQLADKLRAEYPGILRWALEGARDWFAHGLQTPEKILAATKEYREEMDIVARFLAACTIEGEDFSVGSSELYTAYTKWCEKNDAGVRNISQRKLSREMKRRGYQQSKRSGRMWFVGVGLLDEADRPSPEGYFPGNRDFDFD